MRIYTLVKGWLFHVPFEDNLKELIYLEGYRGLEADTQYKVRKHLMENVQ